MAKDREIPCKFYECEHSCTLGKDADFYGLCQTCPSYSPLRHGKPARIDTRKSKIERIEKRKKNNDY